MELDSDNSSSSREQTGGIPSMASDILMTTEQQDDFSPNAEQLDAEAALTDYGSDETRSELSTGSTTSLEQDSSLKRLAEDDDDETLEYRPFKRKRGGLFNNAYLDLINENIEAVTWPTDLGQEGDLVPSQLGLTYWSVREKVLFFHALARYGRLDLPRIAAFVGTKSVIEVNYYIDLLQEACDQRKQTPALRPPLVLAEHPSAVELSQPCCHAQEEFADELSIKVERREQLREENRWGEAWDVTPALARAIDAKRSSVNDSETENPPEKRITPSEAVRKEDSRGKAEGKQREEPLGHLDLPFTQLFHLSRWLRLSRQFFMNSAVPANNWHFVDNKPPSMWVTTFEDFHALAVSFTRRLVQATLFVAMSRIRSQKADQRERDTLVRNRDVEAAIASLGVSQDTWQFWQKAARRLRLDVFQNPPEKAEVEDGEYVEDPISYGKLERYLMRDAAGDLSPASPASSLDDKENEGSETTEAEDGHMVSPEGEAPERLPTESEAAIHLEALEILEHSAVEFPESRRARDALYGRIAMERQQEEEAERFDEHASRVEEIKMWDILKVQPPMELPKPGPDLGTPTISGRSVERVFAVGRGWKETTQYEGEWESMVPPNEDDR